MKMQSFSRKSGEGVLKYVEVDLREKLKQIRQLGLRSRALVRKAG